MKKKKKISLSGWLFYSIAIFIFGVGFAGLFAKQFSFGIPYITDVLIPFFDKYKVETPGFASPGQMTELVAGRHWVFLICLSLSVIISIIGKLISSLFIQIAAEQKKKKLHGKNSKLKNTEKQHQTEPTKSSGESAVEEKIKPKPVTAEKKAPIQKSSSQPFTKPEIKQEKKPEVKKEPPPEPKSGHKSLEELTKQVSDIIQ